MTESEKFLNKILTYVDDSDKKWFMCHKADIKAYAKIYHKEQLTLTDVVKSLKDVSKIVDKIVEESPLLCMPDDKQMQRDYLKEKWTKWFKKEYKL